MLESALTQLAGASTGRDEIAARLDAIAREFRIRPVDGTSPDAGLDAAFDDEMFDLIDQELEISG
jgi:hypothetical protein